MSQFGFYRQYNYGNYWYAGEPASYSACGAFSVANLMNKNPIEIMSWLENNGYAENGHGTKWGGINDCLTAYGYNGQMIGSGYLGITSATAFTVWKKLIQSGQTGVLLMGAYNSTYWTKGGHYISIIGYDVNTDRYLVIDSADANRDGWYTFDKFVGNIKCLYTCGILWGKSDKVFNIEFKECQYGDINNYVLLAQTIMKAKGYYNGDLDGQFGMETRQAVIAVQLENGMEGDGILGRNTMNILTNGLVV